LGAIKLSELKAPHVNKMLKGMSDKGLSARTQNLARATLRKALNDAMDADLIGANAAAKARPAKQDTKQVNPLSPKEVQTLLQHTRGHWYGPLIHAAIGTGMRQGELLGLRWQDVNLDDAVIKIQYAMQRVDGTPTFIKPKTDKSRRTIALDPSTVEALHPQHAQVELARQVAGDRWKEWNLVFPSRVGTPLNPSNVTHQFQQLLEEAGLPRQKFHDLRHCAASLLLSEGVDMKIVQDFLGHSHISLTANTYTHLTEKVRRDTADRMGTVLSGSNPAKGYVEG
jgi:integrase